MCEATRTTLAKVSESVRDRRIVMGFSREVFEVNSNNNKGSMIVTILRTNSNNNP